MNRTIGWWVMTILALIIAAYAIALLFVPAMRAPFLQERFAIMPLAAYLHLAGSGIALAIGPFQLNARLRSLFLRVHRWMGRIYVIAVLFGGAAALALATTSQAGLPTHVGFGLLAVLWLFATGNAYRHIRAGDRVSHRRWMIRSYALTFAAVTLRIYLPLSQIAGMPFDAAYQTIAWLCWVPNLIVAEWIILRQRTDASIVEPSSVVLMVAALASFGCKSKPDAPDNALQKQSVPPAGAPVVQTVSGDAECRGAAIEQAPNVRWVADRSLSADLTYDGAAERVYWGTGGDTAFVVAIVECAEGKPGRVWAFPLRARAMYGTTDLEISLVNPAFGRGFFAENCLGAETTADCRHLGELNARLEAAYQRGGRGLQIGIPDRDNVHVYWDSVANAFQTWRP